jgi:hypothetical protein
MGTSSQRDVDSGPKLQSCLALVGCITIRLPFSSSFVTVLLILKLNLSQTRTHTHSTHTCCLYRPYKGFSDFGLVPFDDSPVVTDSATALIGPQCLSDTNPSGVPCHLGR